MGTVEEGKSARFLERMDKRALRKVPLRKVAKSIRLAPATWALIDTHRGRMGMTIPEFLNYAVWTVTRPYRQASKRAWEGREESTA